MLWLLLTEVALGKMANEQTIATLLLHGGRDIDPEDLARLRSALLENAGLPLGKCAELLRSTDDPVGAVLARIPERVVYIDLREERTLDINVQLVEQRHA
jgi:hypothetical protein